MSLCNAIRYERIEEIKSLITEGSDLFEVSTMNPILKNNTLHVACIKSNIEILKILLRRANELGREYFDRYINSQNDKGQTPLFIASFHASGDFSNHEKVIELLISSGADLNIQDENGNTPLHIALYQDESMSICRLLINQGARLDIENSEGETVRDMMGVPRDILELMDDMDRRKEFELQEKIKKTKMSVLSGSRERTGRLKSKRKKKRKKTKSKQKKSKCKKTKSKR